LCGNGYLARRAGRVVILADMLQTPKPKVATGPSPAPAEATQGKPSAGQPFYKRVLLKISGEGFCPEGGFGIAAPELEFIAKELVEIAQSGVQLAVVVGGGNFIRGATFAEDGRIPRATADYMGMLATVLNACALQETMESLGQPTRVMSAISIYSICEPFIRRRAIRHLEKGRCVILAAGTGNPYFTTDTCAALRATEIAADVLLKATKVDGIYSADPKKDPNAKLYDRLTYQQVHREQLRVMDLTAITLCMERNIPLVVFNVKTPGNIARVVRGENVGTRIIPDAKPGKS
jgi:uridylate kinase